MRKIVTSFFNIILLLLLITNCSSKKINNPKPVPTQNKVVNSKRTTEFAPIKSNIPLFDISSGGKKWVDSVYNKMTFEEKIGQLFMVAAYSNKGEAHIKSINKLIIENNIGGLIFFQGGPVKQAYLTNEYQSNSKLPLFIGNDAEWGLNMRLDSTYKYPYNMTLGAIQDLKLIEQMGEQMGKQSKRLGLQFNFAPVLDINTNPNNPIIGFRSFGEDKSKVADRAIAMIKGLQLNGILATGKHFPGHGDTETDSHKGLPTVNFSKERLNEVEFFPYKKAFDAGLASVMVAHLNVPSLEQRQNYPSSISYNVVTNVLQKELNFKGLIFTDALNMKAVSEFKKPGEIDLDAFLAGNDILLFPENVPVAVEILKKAYSESLFSDERLEFSVKKILKFKYLAGLNKYKPIAIQNLYQDLNSLENKALEYKLYENAITVIENEKSILPIKSVEKQKIAYVKLGDDSNETFLSTLRTFGEVSVVEDVNVKELIAKLKKFTTVIVGYHKSDVAFKKHGFKAEELEKLALLATNNNLILDVFASPYSLNSVPDFKDIEGLVISYQNSQIAQEVSAKLIFGAIEAKGKLPVSISNHYKVNFGLATEKTN